MKKEEIIIWVIVIFGAIALFLAYTDRTPNYNGQNYDEKYNDCIPNPVWGGCN